MLTCYLSSLKPKKLSDNCQENWNESLHFKNDELKKWRVRCENLKFETFCIMTENECDCETFMNYLKRWIWNFRMSGDYLEFGFYFCLSLVVMETGEKA